MDKKKKKLLLLTWHGGAGGVSKIVHDIALVLYRKKKYSLVVGYAKEGGLFAESLVKQGVRIKLFKMRNGFDLLNAFIVYRYIKKNNFDIVHLHYISPLLKWVVCLSARKLIITEHVGVEEYRKKKGWIIFKFFQILTRKCGDFYTTVSQNSKMQLIKNGFVDKDKIKIIPNGIDLSKFDVKRNIEIKEKIILQNNKYLVGTVRGLTPRHGVDHFIKMASFILSERSDTHFIIVGNGPLRESLEILAIKLKIDKHVSFLGERQDVTGILAKLDVIVMPSAIETFGISAIEAMAMKKPVVSYAVGGLSEVIDDGRTGILVHSRDPKKLAQAVNFLLDNEIKRIEFGIKGREKVEKYFALYKIVEKYINLYESI